MLKYPQIKAHTVYGFLCVTVKWSTSVISILEVLEILAR